MTRLEFHRQFRRAGPVVLPVVHVLNTAQTLDNLTLLTKHAAPGCFLINHDFGVPEFLPIIREVRAAHPNLWIGVNFLAVTGDRAFPQLAELAADGCRIDAYWADDARIDETGLDQAEAESIRTTRASSEWQGMYFGGTAFKKQRPVAPEKYRAAAENARPFMDVVTTSGVATGQQADAAKIKEFRAGAGDRPLALASGITPENAAAYKDVDCFMVATGVNFPGNFYEIDPDRLATLLEVCHELGEQT